MWTPTPKKRVDPKPGTAMDPKHKQRLWTHNTPLVVDPKQQPMRGANSPGNVRTQNRALAWTQNANNVWTHDTHASLDPNPRNSMDPKPRNSVDPKPRNSMDPRPPNSVDPKPQNSMDPKPRNIMDPKPCSRSSTKKVDQWFHARKYRTTQTN